MTGVESEDRGIDHAGSLQILRDARAILAVAATRHWRRPRRDQAPSYMWIAQEIGLSDEAQECAERIWNVANGSGGWGPEAEERAFERCCEMLKTEQL